MDLKVRYIEGNENNVGDPYPSTLAKALEMLEIWEISNISGETDQQMTNQKLYS